MGENSSLILSEHFEKSSRKAVPRIKKIIYPAEWPERIKYPVGKVPGGVM